MSAPPRSTRHPGLDRRGTRRDWSLLLAASAFEIVFAMSANAAEGLTRLGPSVLMLGTVAAAVFLLSKALRSIDVAVGYAVWTGIGMVGTVVLGCLLFDEAFSAGKVVCLLLIVGGVVSLHGAPQAPRTGPTDPEATDAGVGVGTGGRPPAAS